MKGRGQDERDGVIKEYKNWLIAQPIMVQKATEKFNEYIKFNGSCIKYSKRNFRRNEFA